MSIVHAVLAIVQEAIADLRRSPGINGISILTMAVSLALVGAFLLLSSNLQGVLDRWTGEVRVDVFLLDDATSDDREALGRALESDGLVHSVEYVDRDVALDEFRVLFPDLAAVPDELESNPFPASMRATLVQPPPSLEELAALAGEYSRFAGVEEVRYDQSWIEKLSSLLRLFSVAALVVGGILALAALFTMSSVIRLNVYARQEEIALQRLVGATANFIRGPFVAQGMIQGLAAAAVALLAVFFLQTALIQYGQGQGNALLLLAVGQRLTVGAWLFVIGLGALIGLVGSATAVRRFLTL